ncbi:MAG TPA: F0F1 ATP synthase subunit A [Croceibacterium sp.]|nr:F0F1 ATP synthase subunit A [Croceibacterium sp.]
MAAAAKIDPMHQFTIAPLGGGELAATPFQFTNSALWMLIVLGAILWFMWGGTRQKLVPGRWQAAVEVVTGFLGGIAKQNIGPEGRAYLPWIFTAFMFILFSNWIGALPLAIVGPHPFTVTSQFTVTGVMSIISFAIVLGVGFWKHGLHFFSLFVPHGTPFVLKLFIAPVEFISFLVRPFSLGLRPFIAMFAGHVLLDVFGNFVVQGLNAGGPVGYGIGLLSFVFVVGVNALELLVGAIQAFVFALLTALYIKDAVHLH